VCLGQDDKLFFCLNEFKDYFGRTICFELKDNDFILHGCLFEQFIEVLHELGELCMCLEKTLSYAI
jgi:hypothetical protein